MDYNNIDWIFPSGSTSRYDPTEVREWGQFRQLTMGDSSMLAAKDKIEDWRHRGDSFGQRFGNYSNNII